MRDKKLIDYYDTRAPEYEQIYFRDNPERRGEIDDEAARVRQLASGKTVLELACGTGYWTQILAERSTYLVSSDYSLEMIRQARQKDFVTQPGFVRADLYHPPFAQNAFDLVALGFWFSHHPKEDYQNLFDLLRGPLKKEGLIWMIDNNPPAEGPETHSVRVDDHGNNYKKRFLDSGEEHVILKNYFSEEELRRLFSADFKILRLTYKKYYWAVLLKERQ